MKRMIISQSTSIRLTIGFLIVFAVGSPTGVRALEAQNSLSKPKKNYKVIVTPDEVTLQVEDTFQFNAHLEDKDGNVVEADFNWSLSGQNIGSISSDGVFVALKAGHAHVVASYENKSGRAKVTVVSTGDDDKWSQVLVEPSEPVIKVGDQLQFTATLLDSQDPPTDTKFVWSLSNDALGTITEDGLFTALDRGNTFVYATVGDLQGRARVTIQNSTHWDNRKDGRLTIVPEDTIVTLGSVVQYRAVFVYSTGEKVDTTVEWKAMGRHIGDMIGDGVFTATDFGTGLIRAKFKRYLAMTRVMVAGVDETDTAEADTVHMVFPSDTTGQATDTTGQEGTTVFTFDGLPWPMSMLNGGQVIFPPGSLEENITIHVTMPNFAIYEDDSTVSYGELILNGVSFHVYVGDSLASPYYFDPPAHLVLPYDSTLMQELNMTPDDLWMFFYTEQNGLDSTGISHVVVDEVNSRIYAEVSHFSTLAIASRNSQAQTLAGNLLRYALPVKCRLYSNTPNPFNPETVIRFDISGNSRYRIRLSVFNILGQELRTLIEGEFSPGIHEIRWDGKDAIGRPVESGVYIYRLEGEQFSLSRRMILLR